MKKTTLALAALALFAAGSTPAAAERTYWTCAARCTKESSASKKESYYSIGQRCTSIGASQASLCGGNSANVQKYLSCSVVTDNRTNLNRKGCL